jgi:mono/diheme cytochrome c family protein
VSPRAFPAFLSIAAGLVAALPAARAAANAASATLNPVDLQFFEARVRPVLVENCYKCHSHDADKIKGGLMLDTREGLMHGGNTGAAIVAGKPEDSLLIDAISYNDENLQMPPKGAKLPDQEIADLTEWVRRGAPDPRTGVAQGSSLVYGGVGRQHWAFLPVQHQDVPSVADSAWCKTPIDHFVLTKLQAAGIKPNPPADRRTLIRRVTFDLTGLPPTEAEVQAFLADDSPDAYAALVDRLLASPHYGERWARYWMDVARYSDTKGEPANRQAADPRYPDAWTYRDYLIDAFNSDKPYNQFIIEQLAADRILIPKYQAAEKTHSEDDVDGSSAAALGFLTLGNQFDGSVNDVINDRIDVTTKAFLGLTVSCARCHDHKFDPIPTADYYSLYGVFANTFEPKKESDEPFIHALPRTPALVAYLEKLGPLEQQQDQLAGEFASLRRSRMDPDVRKERRKSIQKQQQDVARQIADLEMKDPGAPPRASVLLDLPRTHDYPILVHGEAGTKGPVVPRRFLEILSGPNRPIWRSDSGRLELAEAIADPSNPLTARVLVNRLWQQHFGAGFVPTPDDLGNQSAPPTDPELLDYLAARFMSDGWSIKKLQRLIVMSSVYQESSSGNSRYEEVDPDDNLLWHYSLHRLDFEEIHDELLQIAGTLDLDAIGGRSIQLGSSGFITRRAIYTFIDRRNPPELFTQFDFPNPNVPSGRRYNTIVPQQSLFLMNSPLVIEAARKLTHRPEFADLSSDEERVASLFEAVYQRLPTPQETTLCLRYVESTPGGTSLTVAQRAPAQNDRQAEAQARLAAKQADLAGAGRKNNLQVQPGGAALRSRAPLDAWTKLAHALFQTNEAVFID